MVYETLHWIGIALLFCLPILILRRRYQVGWKWFGLGIASWAVGVVVKMALYGVEDGLGAAHLGRWGHSGLVGLTSGLAELGAAAWVLRKAHLRLPEILAFGVGIGAIEIPFSLLLGTLEELDPAAKAVAAVGALPFWMHFELLVQRALAMLAHVATRLLVYLSLRWRNALPALVALLGFVLTDGGAAYGIEAHWNWDDPGVLGRYYLFIAIVGAVELAVAWLLVRRLLARRTALWQAPDVSA